MARPDWHKTADELAQELLVTIRKLGGEREGEYQLVARLSADGNYFWNWAWWPPGEQGWPPGGQGGVTPGKAGDGDD